MDVLTRGKIGLNLDGTPLLDSGRGGAEIKGMEGGYRLFKPSAMKIWCNIQIIIYPFIYMLFRELQV